MALQLPSGPINYGVDIPDPSQSFLQAFKTGTAITETRMAQEKAQREAEQQQLISQAFQRMRQPGATAKDYADLAMMLPETQAKAVRESFSMINADQQQNALTQAGQVFSAFKSGKPDIAVGLIERQIEAKRNSGDEGGARFLETWRDVAKENPKAAEDYFGFSISQMPGGDKVIDAVVKLQGSPADTEFRAVMAGARTVEDIFDRIPQLAQLGEKGMEYAKNFLTQQRLMEKQAAEGIGLAEQRAEENNAIKKAYGLLKTVMPEGAFELQKIGAGYDIAPSSSFSDMIQTSGGIKIDESKAGMLGIDRETMMAIRGIAQTDPKMAASMIADVVKARIKQQYAPQKAQRMSPAALKLVDAGYEYGSPDFVKQMRQGILAERTGQEKGQGAAGIIPVDKRPEAEGKFRKEYSDQTKGYQEVKSAYGRVLASEDNAVGDLSLIFGYMKMLDPGSVVREGEFATAQNAAGVPERIQNIYNQVVSGQRLSPSQRQSFKGQAGKLYSTAQTQEAQVRQGIERIAKGYGLNTANIFYTPTEVAPTVPGAAPGAPAPAPGAPVSVTAPNGQVLTFPSQQAADAFKKAAGIR